jgi:hypothetical protein
MFNTLTGTQQQQEACDAAEAKQQALRAAGLGELLDGVAAKCSNASEIENLLASKPTAR